MAHHEGIDELRHTPPGLPEPRLDFEGVLRSARWRRIRRYGALSVAAAILVVGAVVPLVVLSGLRAGTHPSSPRRVSPHVAARLHIPSGAVDVTVGEGSVWVSGFGALTRIDQGMDRVVATIHTPGVEDYSRVAVGEGSAWVSADRGLVYRIDPKTNRVSAMIRTGSYAGAVAVGGGSVWVTSSEHSAGNVVQIDPATNRVVRSIHVGLSPVGILYAAGSVWVSTNEAPYALWRIDPARGRVRQMSVGAFGQPGPLTFGDGDIWTTANGETDSVLRIDPSTGKVVKQIPVPLAERVTFEKGWVWVLTSPPSSSRTIFLPSPKHPGTIRRIDPMTGRVVGKPLRVRGLQPISLAAGSGALWVADYQGGFLTRIDLEG
jgi:YVTN family beta-propeller protein